MRTCLCLTLLALLVCPFARPTHADAQDKVGPKQGPLELRVVAKKATYTWDGGGKSPKEFRKMLDEFVEAQKKQPNFGGAVLPAQPPVVELALEITNKGMEDVTVYVGGDTNVYTFDLKGPGAY